MFAVDMHIELKLMMIGAAYFAQYGIRFTAKIHSPADALSPDKQGMRGDFMYCYNCPFWMPNNSYTVNGVCTASDITTRADTECLDIREEVKQDEAV